MDVYPVLGASLY